MKTIPPVNPEPPTGPQYWRSLDEVADTPEFRQWVEREFPAGASELEDAQSRRHFVKLMSASFLLAGFGLTGCRRPEENILPFSRLPEGYTHGAAQHFATALPSRQSAVPLLVKSNDGRPTKLEGNAAVPGFNGGTDAFTQAAILNLYDPDRATRYTHQQNSVKREEALDFLARLAKQSAANRGAGLSFLLERNDSPTRARLVTDLQQRLPEARWHIYEPVDFAVADEAAALAFGGGRKLRQHFQFENARRIVSLDCDFLGAEPDSYRHVRGFAQSRKLDDAGGKMSRLYVVEPLMTVTGGNADHRLRQPASHVLGVAARLFAELMKQSNAEQRDPRAGEFRAALLKLGEGTTVEAKWLSECAKDLLAHAGASLVVAGHRQPLAVHLLACAFNSVLGNIGTTVRLWEDPQPATRSLADLAQALNAGQVETLIVLGGNPVYNAPADLNWATTQRKAKTVVRLGYYEDETFPVSDWHLPLAHSLESWGDARTSDGTLLPIQPLIEPLFNGLSELEVLARVGGLHPPKPYELVRETYRQLTGDAGWEERWKIFLHAGYLADSAPAAIQAEIHWEAAAPAILAGDAPKQLSAQSLEAVFHRDYSVDDGRYNNNGWLHEMPDPVTRLVWENVILLSPATARELGVDVVDHEDNKLYVPVIEVNVGGRTVEGPAWIQPGQADNVIALALGYGRERTGRVGRGSGYNAYRVRPAATPHAAVGAQISRTGRRHELASTQNHWLMEGRPLIREANLEQYRKNSKFAQRMNLEEPEVAQPMYPNPLDKIMPNATHQWGMSIDLHACVGCSACVIACQSENNIPIVGKQQVARSREMHWLRVDRYYAGDLNDPQVSSQPMLCQHCESAPCESVCPVNATAHDDEGLNLMVYNRCVGTRYCSNNCPFKVRRFNFLDYNRRPLEHFKGPVYPSPLTHVTDGQWDLLRWFKDPDRGYKPGDEWDLIKLARNPDVTVRMRGVMEKCTFCVQRIEQGKIAQKVKARDSGDVAVPDGTIRTACQQACPADAIVFGNIKDPASRVAQLKADDRTYKVLEFLAVRPRTTYQARVRNPNPDMPGYHELPLTAAEWQQRNPLLEGHGGHESGTEAPAHTGEKGGH